MEYKYLSVKELLDIHSEILRVTGGERGILFPGNLDLCIEAPQRYEYGFEPYVNIFQKAASLIFEIIKLHPFVDGNKRTAYTATDIFLDLNGYKMESLKDEAINFSKEIAKCRIGISEILEWILCHTTQK